MIDYEKELQELAAQESLRALPTRDTSGMLNLSTNDYLGLNDREELWEEFRHQYNVGTRSMSAASSRLLTGNHPEYVRAEQTLSELYGGRAALYYNCGYHANSGVLPALTDKRDLVMADKLIHASLIDGLQLSKATMMRYMHNDMGHLRRQLEAHRHEYERVIIVTESIFSMDGDRAPLAELVELKKEFDCWLYVDEAHGVGVCGKQGEGVVGELGLTDDVEIVVGTCGKALASAGAYVICSETVKQYLVNKSRTMIFTTGMPPISVAWTEYVLRRMAGMDSERANLRQLWQTLNAELGTHAESQIVPYVCGANAKAVGMSKRLQEAGYYVLPIRHPTVPQGQARLRLSLKANMTKEQMVALATTIKREEERCNTEC